MKNKMPFYWKKQRNKFLYIISSLIFLTCFILVACNHSQRRSLETNNYVDSLCLLAQTDREEFNSAVTNLLSKAIFSDSRHIPEVKEFYEKICYLKYNKQSGDYDGVFLFINNNLYNDTAIVFKYMNKKFQFNKKTFYLDENILDKVCTDSLFFKSRHYISDGSNELLTYMTGDFFSNGLLYLGCSSYDIRREIYVTNKALLDLLTRLRKLIYKI